MFVKYWTNEHAIFVTDDVSEFYVVTYQREYVTDDFLQVKKIYNCIARNTLYDFIAFFFRLSWGHCSYNANFNY